MLDRVRDRIDAALASGRRLVFQASVVPERTEEVMQYGIERFFEEHSRQDLSGPVHAGVRELVQNASKAGLKRVLFAEMGADPLSEENYQKVMDKFRKHLIESKRRDFRPRMVRQGFALEVSLQTCGPVAVVAVTNRFALLPREEQRIREKFGLAQEFDNLYEFYLQYGDSSEGAGMGIAMVEILLKQAGVPGHNFTISSANGSTEARILIPLEQGYRSPRVRFQEELERRGCTAEALRTELREGHFRLGFP